MLKTFVKHNEEPGIILVSLYKVALSGSGGLEKLPNLRKTTVQGRLDTIKYIIKLHKHGIAPSCGGVPQEILYQKN